MNRKFIEGNWKGKAAGDIAIVQQNQCFDTDLSSFEKGQPMSTRLATSAVFIGALLAPLAGYSADADTDRSSPKAFVKDSVITSKIKAQMAMDKQVSALHIRVDTDSNGIVTLSGTAKSQKEVDKALSIAQGVEGVVAVESHIQIAARR